MKKVVWFVTCSVMILGSVTLVDGQFQPGGGGGFGGFGGQQPALTLLNRADVKKELDITDEQLNKLPPEILVAISKVLNEKQFKRFKQIELQKRGNDAFVDETVQTSLSMTADQKKSIKSLVEDSKKEIADLQPKFGGGGKGGKGGTDFKGAQEKQENVRKETKEKIYTVLTKEQRTTWRGLVGEEFKFEQPKFGGGGGFGKDKKADPKKDAE